LTTDIQSPEKHVIHFLSRDLLAIRSQLILIAWRPRRRVETSPIASAVRSRFTKPEFGSFAEQMKNDWTDFPALIG